jgi:putative ABC transport system permease protein
MFRMSMKMAWQNLWRRKRRSLMVILMIVLSLSGLLSLQGLYDGMVVQMINNTVRSDCGDLSITAKGYRLSRSLDDIIRDSDAVSKALKEDRSIRSFTLRVRQEGLLATARKSLGAEITGISLEHEKTFGRLDEFVIEGSYDWGPRERGAIIGYDLADKMGVGVDDRIIFSAQDATGEISSVALRVRGIVKTNNPAIDLHAVFADIGFVRRFLQIGDGTTQVAVFLNERSELAAVQRRLSDEFGSLEVKRWDELYPSLVQIREIMKYYNSASYAIVFIVAALGIFGVMLVSVLERLREFGILLAIGTPYAMVRNQILFEASFLGLVGFAGGALLGGVLLAYAAHYGLDLSAWKEGLESFGYSAVIFAQIEASYFLEAFTSVYLAALFSVLWPLRVLKKIKPIHVIQGS